MRHIQQIVDDMVQHARKNPDHGMNCACKDEYIREARALIHDAGLELDIPYSQTYQAHWSYLLHALTKRLK